MSFVDLLKVQGTINGHHRIHWGDIEKQVVNMPT